MLKPMSANENVNFLCSVLPEKEGLGEPISTCLLSMLPDPAPRLPVAAYKEGNSALINQQMPL